MEILSLTFKSIDDENDTTDITTFSKKENEKIISPCFRFLHHIRLNPLNLLHNFPSLPVLFRLKKYFLFIVIQYTGSFT